MTEAQQQEQIGSLLDRLLRTQEELCPELKASLFKNERLGMEYINHPFYCNLLHIPAENAMANQALKEKRRIFDEAVKEGNWVLAIDLIIEKPFRVEYLLKYQSKIPDDQYWELLRFVWSGVENLWQYKGLIHLLFKGRDKGTIREMFHEDDLPYWDTLPGAITIYRGCTLRNKMGWSWTLSKKTAKWFANRFWQKRPRVYWAVVPKDSCICYINSRDEQEVIINPSLLTDIKEEK
jgi:hypothetical protein